MATNNQIEVNGLKQQMQQESFQNPDKKGNIRDYATIEQLLVIANMESFNAILIEQGYDKKT